MRERRYKYTVWEGPLRQAQGPGFLRYGTVGELAELAVKFRDQGSFGTVGELASGEPAEPVELADINCARVKDTAWILKAKNGTPHTRS